MGNALIVNRRSLIAAPAILAANRAIAGLPPGIHRNDVRNTARPSNRWAQQIWIRGASTITGPRFGIQNIAAEAPFNWVRIWYSNATGTAFQVDATYVQANSRVYGDGLSPTQANMQPYQADGATPFGAVLPVYSNAGGLDSQPGELTGTTLPLIVPAGTAANPAYACTDWAQCASVARFDGSSRPLLHVRSLISGNATLISKVATTDWDDAPTNLGRIWQTYDVGGSGVTSAAPSGTEVIRSYVTAVEFIGPGYTYSVMANGDSRTQGLNSATTYNSWHHRATNALSSSTRPVSDINNGWTAQTVAQYVARGVTALRRYRPSIVILCPWSPNDTGSPTQAIADAGYAATMQLAKIAVEQGCVPIFWTPFADSEETTTLLQAPRLSIVNRLRALKATGNYLVADVDAAISDYTVSPGVIKAPFNSDNRHLNDAGIDTSAAVIQQQIQRAIGA